MLHKDWAKLVSSRRSWLVRLIKKQLCVPSSGLVVQVVSPHVHQDSKLPDISLFLVGSKKALNSCCSHRTVTGSSIPPPCPQHAGESHFEELRRGSMS